MNKWLVICLCGILSVLMTESSGKSSRQKLIKALREKFQQFKMKSVPEPHEIKESLEHESKSVLPSRKHAKEQRQHDKAASAIGLALLDLGKQAKHPNTLHPDDHKKGKAIDKSVNKHDDMDKDDDDDDDDDSDDDDVDHTKKTKEQHMKNSKGKMTDQEDNKKLKNESGVSSKKNEKDNDDDDWNDDDNSDAINDNESGSRDISDTQGKEEGRNNKNSEKKLKNSVTSLKKAAEKLKDKGLQSVDVGELKKLLATSVENLDKAEKAIHDLLQYDEKKKSAHKNNPAPPPPTQGYSQQYGGYPQVSMSAYQQSTCPGQCSSLCAPTCRDPCCRFPPNSGYNSAPVVARGSYQEGLINAYPPLTTLGNPQSSMGNQGQGFGQQCGSQCTPPSCASSCNPSCCSPSTQNMGPIIPQGQMNSGCPSGCLNNCAQNCPSRCCVPGRR